MSIDSVETTWKLLQVEPWNRQHWITVLDDCITTGNLVRIRQCFDAVLQVFPCDVPLWIKYLSIELKLQEYDKLMKLFELHLKRLPDLRVWQLYVDFVSTASQDADDSLERVEAALERAVTSVGYDWKAFPLWKRYIDFIDAIKVSNEEEESGKNEALRKVYQRALSVPMQDLDMLWHSYETFENSVNQQLAQATLHEYKQLYCKAKTTFNQRREARSLIDQDFASYPPHLVPAYERTTFRQQVTAWQQVLNLEANVDATTINIDLAPLAFQQALLHMSHLPHIWYDYVRVLHTVLDSSELESIRDIWRQCRQTIPYSSLPLLMWMEWEERWVRQQDFIREQYECVIKQEDMTELEATRRRFQCSFPTGQTVMLYPGEQHLLHQGDPLIAIQYYRFACRNCAADDVAPGRKEFLWLRKTPFSSYHLFLQAATAEYLRLNDPAKGDAIMAFALDKMFKKNVDLRIRYATLLTQLGHRERANQLVQQCMILQTQSHQQGTSLAAFGNGDEDSEDWWCQTFIMKDPLHTAPPPFFISMWKMRVAESHLQAQSYDQLMKLTQERNDSLEIVFQHEILGVVERTAFANLWPCTGAYRELLIQLFASARKKKMLQTSERGVVENDPQIAQALMQMTATVTSTTAVTAGAVMTSGAGHAASLLHKGAKPAAVVFSNAHHASQSSVFASTCVRPDMDRARFKVHTVRDTYGFVLPPLLHEALCAVPPVNLYRGTLLPSDRVFDILHRVASTSQQNSTPSPSFHKRSADESATELHQQQMVAQATPMQQATAQLDVFRQRQLAKNLAQQV